METIALLPKYNSERFRHSLYQIDIVWKIIPLRRLGGGWRTLLVYSFTIFIDIFHICCELRRIVSDLTRRDIGDDEANEIIESHSFARRAGRNVGEENTRSFMRKGVVDDWKNYFDLNARERFRTYAGDALMKLGYETSQDWISNNSGIDSEKMQ